jgi:uncharacterized protein
MNGRQFRIIGHEHARLLTKRIATLTQSSEPDANQAGHDDGGASTAPQSQSGEPPAGPPDALSDEPPNVPPNAATPTPIVIGAGPQQLDPRFVTVDRITNWIVAGVIGTLLIVYLGLQWTLINMALPWQLATTGGALLVISGLVFRAHWYPVLWHRAASYELSDIAIEIRTGVLFKNVMTVPRSRVQHTDVTQGPLMRRYGVATLVIHTAGTQHAKVSLHGLSREHADAIRDRLIAHVAKGNGPTGKASSPAIESAQPTTAPGESRPNATNKADPSNTDPSESSPSETDPGQAGALRAD